MSTFNGSLAKPMYNFIQTFYMDVAAYYLCPAPYNQVNPFRPCMPICVGKLTIIG